MRTGHTERSGRICGGGQATRPGHHQDSGKFGLQGSVQHVAFNHMRLGLCAHSIHVHTQGKHSRLHTAPPHTTRRATICTPRFGWKHEVEKEEKVNETIRPSEAGLSFHMRSPTMASSVQFLSGPGFGGASHRLAGCHRCTAGASPRAKTSNRKAHTGVRDWLRDRPHADRTTPGSPHGDARVHHGDGGGCIPPPRGRIGASPPALEPPPKPTTKRRQKNEWSG